MIPQLCDKSNTRICACFFPCYHVKLQSLNVILRVGKIPTLASHQMTLEARMMETKTMLEVQFIEVAIVHLGERNVNFLVSLHKN
jgi:hypothetical protein